MDTISATSGGIVAWNIRATLWKGTLPGKTLTTVMSYKHNDTAR